MKKTLLIGAALFAGICATAQNLNPTVEVTNTYVREATGIEKPLQKMEVPDSVMRFNLDFDYSVRSTPYMGSYEFKPYFVQLRPQARPSTEGKLFVRLGAGYTLRPEATVVWSPIQKGKFRLNLYADHESFFGQFKGIGLQDNQLVDSGNRVKGNQMRTQVGADALFGWNSGRLTAGVAYKNIGAHVGDRGPFPHHFFLANARIQSLPNTKFSYSLGTKVSFMGGYLAENHSFTDGHIGGNFGIHHVWLGASFEHVSTDGKFGGDVAVSPHYLLEVGRFHMDLGVKLSFALNNQNPDFYPTKAGYVFPDAYVSFDAVPDALVLYTSATGKRSILSAMPISPYIDGYVLKETFDEACVDGSLAQVPYMIGFTLNDSGNMAGQISEFCLNRQEMGGKAYAYQFARPLPTDGRSNVLQGAFHSSDLWFVFKSLEHCWRPWTQGDWDLAEKELTYWTNFAKYGDPNGPEGGEWTPYTAEKPEFMVFKLDEADVEASAMGEPLRAAAPPRMGRPANP